MGMDSGWVIRGTNGRFRAHKGYSRAFKVAGSQRANNGLKFVLTMEETRNTELPRHACDPSRLVKNAFDPSVLSGEDFDLATHGWRKDEPGRYLLECPEEGESRAAIETFAIEFLKYPHSKVVVGRESFAQSQGNAKASAESFSWTFDGAPAAAAFEETVN